MGTNTEEQPSLAKAMAMMEQHLQSLKEDGVREIEVSPAVLKPVPRTMTASSIPASPPRVIATEQPGLAEIARRIAACTKCGLCKTRNRVVPGQGNPHPEIMFIGEGPGTDEDRQGLAFVGRAGQLLTRMITAMGFSRDDVFIGNIVKCRPTIDNAGHKDRPPEPEEMAACIPYLHEQIALLKPKVIVALGATAVRGLFGLEGITKLRGKWLSFDGIDVMPTFHPSFVLRKGGDHGEGDREVYMQVWSDLTAAMKKIGREPPAKKK